jgi:hypothetical protein
MKKKITDQACVVCTQELSSRCALHLISMTVLRDDVQLNSTPMKRQCVKIEFILLVFFFWKRCSCVIAPWSNALIISRCEVLHYYLQHSQSKKHISVVCATVA